MIEIVISAGVGDESWWCSARMELLTFKPSLRFYVSLGVTPSHISWMSGGSRLISAFASSHSGILLLSFKAAVADRSGRLCCPSCNPCMYMHMLAHDRPVAENTYCA
jgi:hypothetical protein